MLIEIKIIKYYQEQHLEKTTKSTSAQKLIPKKNVL